MELKGKVALVTGGAKGIGLSIARELLRNEIKGVAILDIDDVQGKTVVDKLTSEHSTGSVIFIKADVTKRSQFEEAFEETIRTFNQLDIVINNAGIIQEIEWEKCVAVNLQGYITGSLLAMDKYFPTSVGDSECIILNISSVAGLLPSPEIAVYSGTKEGIIGFSRALSKPSRARGLNVKVLVVCPGATSTGIFPVKKNQMSDDMIAVFNGSLKSVAWQNPGDLACHIISIMKEGDTGSVWAVDNNVRTQIQFTPLFDYPVQ